MVQPVADGSWLVHTDREVHIVKADGSTESRYPTGWVKCFQATSTGRAWVGYGEQDILGTGVGRACFSAFERDGTASFKYTDGEWQPGQVQPLNINAINVFDDAETWILGTGEDSLLVRMKDLSLAESWTWSNRGTSRGPYGFGIAVDGERLLVSAFSGPNLELWDLNSKRVSELVAVGDTGPLPIHRAVGRGTVLYLMTWDAVYSIDLLELGTLYE